VDWFRECLSARRVHGVGAARPKGYPETIGYQTHRMTLNLSPSEQGEMWVLEDATCGAYETLPLAY
jgi:hypothetical protein